MSGRKQLLGLDDEIRDHLERETQDNIDRGMTPEAAYSASRRKFGNVLMAKEDARAVWIPVWIDQLVQDAGYGVRMLRHSAGFSAVVIATLALGIGANAAIFSVIRAVLLKPPPYADANRLVLLGEKRPDSPGYSGAISAPNYLDWAQQNTVFEQMAAVTGGGRHAQRRYDRTRVRRRAHRLGVVLRGVRDARRPRPNVRARRRSTREGTRRRAQSPFVGLAVRLGSGRYRQTCPPRRRAVHGDRRDARGDGC